jgi:hypothetical protein
MNEKTQRYPLAWPMNWKRTSTSERRRAVFRRTTSDARQVMVNGAPKTETRTRTVAVTIAVSLDRLEGELNRLGATDPLLSTNVPVGPRGMPQSSGPEPRDTGAAVYVTFQGKPLVFACDKWDRVADNIVAIAQHIDALRRIERYGVGKLDQAFAGYKALPPSAEDWRIVLGVGDYATLDQVDAAFLEKAKTAHPDAGGRHEDMAKLTAARDFARKVLS